MIMFHRVGTEGRYDSGFRNIFWLEKKSTGESVSEVICPIASWSII